MYKVEVRHHTKAWRNGDLEDALDLVSSELFKTRKAAKGYIERELCKRHGTIHMDWHKGDTPSYCYCFTGVKWQHENSGAEMQEYYEYKLSKVKAK